MGGVWKNQWESWYTYAFIFFYSAQIHTSVFCKIKKATPSHSFSRNTLWNCVNFQRGSRFIRWTSHNKHKDPGGHEKSKYDKFGTPKVCFFDMLVRNMRFDRKSGLSPTNQSPDYSEMLMHSINYQYLVDYMRKTVKKEWKRTKNPGGHTPVTQFGPRICGILPV